MIEIKDISGKTRFSTPINKGAKGKFTLMKEDYIILPFSVPSPIPFKLGDYVDLSGVLDESLGGKLAKIYEITDLQKPTYNTSTGGYDYELKMNAYYWKWKNKIFKYTPEQAGGEASWSLTAALDVQLGVFLRNLKALGYTYKGTDFTFSIDDTVENKAVAMTYDNINLLDALFSMAGEDKWNCDCWITDNVIHFGRNEFGDAVKIERGIEASDITRSESEGTYATRIYAFGSTKNIPTNYRPTDEQVVINGIVQKRLMLPADTPYIDAYEGMSQEEAIEDVVVFDDVYPRQVGTLSDVHTRTEKVESEDGTKETVTYYRYKDSGLTFKEEYIIEGQELQITFQSGKLNGMAFGVIFNPDPKDESRGEQLWEIVRNENYGRPLPDDMMYPANGDKYILSGFNIQLVSDQYIPEAEQELKDKAQKYAEKVKKDDGTYPVTLRSDWVHEDLISRTFEFGQRINLVDDTYFENGRISRVLGWEMSLDVPWDSPVYTIGESMPYSRIGEIEDKVDALTYKGQVYTGNGSGSVYVIKVNDSTPPSDSNVFSALRSLKMFLRKDQQDETNYLLSLLGGILVNKIAKFGNFITGVSGGMIDDEGNMEMESGYFRKRLFVPEIAYNRITYFKGRAVISPGGGCKVKSYIKNDDGSFTVIPDLTEADGLSQFVDDILSAFFTTKNEEGKLTGFAQMQFRVTEADYDAKTFKMVNRPGNNYEPGEEMILAQTGNFTDLDRQTYILFDTLNGNNCITFFDNANTWDPEPAQMKSWLGKKKGMKVQGFDCDNYSAVLQNILMTGLIFQTDTITGQPIRVPLDKGAWEAGPHAYFDRVSHNGSLWLCINPEGTESEPADNNPDWLKQVAEGQRGLQGLQGPQGTPGQNGTPGASFIPCGAWISGNVPYKKNSAVEFAENAFVALRDTSAPPYAIAKYNNGNYVRTPQGYLLAGTPSTNTLHPDWQRLTNIEPPTLYWLDSSCSSIAYTSTGSMSPSAFTVSCKKNRNGVVGKCAELWLVARKYDGSWRSHAGPVQSASISVPAASGCTQFAVRAYWSSSEANAWSDNYVAEIGIGVAEAGATGATGAFPRDRGPWRSGESYEWSADYRDKVIHPFNGVYYNFLVRTQGSTVTDAPTSANGDDNWEAMNKLVNIATDTLFSDGANVAGFMFSGGVMKSQQSTNGVANMILNGNTGYFHCVNAEITGKFIGNISADSGTIGGFSIGAKSLSNLAADVSLSIGNYNNSSTKLFSVNRGTSAMLQIRHDSGICISAETYGSSDSIAIKALCNASGYGQAIQAYGNVSLLARSTEKTRINGVVVNTRRITSSATINANDDFLIFGNSGNITVTMPSTSASPAGKILYMKRVSGSGAITLSGSFRNPNNSGGASSLVINDDVSRFFVRDDQGYWVQYTCG